MKLAYLVNQYPKASHSFIRREILALESLGHSVSRFALRSDAADVVDAQDIAERERTRYILSGGPGQFARSLFACVRSAPLATLRAFIDACRIGWGSERGVLLHLAYFLEAAVLVQWCREAEVEHVHAHFGTNSTTIAMLARTMGGCAYSFTVHGPEEFDKAQFIALPEKIRQSSFTVAITSFCRSQLYRLVEHTHWDKIKIVHCGLDEDFLRATPLREAANDEEQVPVLTCVGRLCEQKGQLLLIDAVRELVSAGHQFRLVLAGDGPMRPEIERAIAEYQLQDVVAITGWISSAQVKTCIEQSKALVLPSFAEGLPVVLMEAMALGKPVLTTYIAGIPELVEEGRSGWLVPAGSRERLRQALEAVLAAPDEQCSQMGEVGRSRVLADHDAQREAQTLASYLEAYK
ncbi:colanic acid biosynthesis glycosyltransferase WcaL [Mangrovimicrobium sediminis]|uniref:Colanic acid biosynthesis glycosyltransferase WcaL n=1 Tax=Mangrovimicrobium sediminis TaxID=2562682 RepID=A0A4Z0M3E5_9GAMM|nr:glycosyltransferase family 4 protein [Haliea sp. SAOS-164]TGD73967.1 colanic acid biosynthesis glycosyltransferase WcaL [Haliea sp. SAOS-164]